MLPPVEPIKRRVDVTLTTATHHAWNGMHVNIGYYTGSRTTTCVINYLLYDKINQGRNEFSTIDSAAFNCRLTAR